MTLVRSAQYRGEDISTDNPPTGAGEDGLVGGAIGNAVAVLTGVRLRELPFAPERVRGALGA